MHSSPKSMQRLMLVAAAAGLALTASPVLGQGYSAYDAGAYGPSEEVIVTAPPFRAEGGTLDIPGRPPRLRGPDPDRPPPDAPPGLPTGKGLVEAVEKYLRQARGDEPPPPAGPAV